MKTLEEYFADWESHVFGYGYGDGEWHILPTLKEFMAFVPSEDAENRNYDFQILETKLRGAVTWFLINALCHADIIEYGTSPRFGWLTKKGYSLKRFIDSKTADELYDITAGAPDAYTHCYPDACNCGEHGYEKGRKCDNPFWS